MSNLSSWFMGSLRLASSATIVCNGSDVVIPAGTYYGRDPTAGLSLIGLIQTGLAAVVPGTTVYIGRDRYLRIVSGGVALTLTIPAALQAALGLVGAPTPGTTITAASRSNLLWSPGWCAKPVYHPVGVPGLAVDDVVQKSSPTGETFRTTFHHRVLISGWTVQWVEQSLGWTGEELGGEYKRFFDDVIRYGRRVKHYERVTEDDASGTSVTWPSTPMGPYVITYNPKWYRRSIDVLDDWSDFELEATVTGEIT